MHHGHAVDGERIRGGDVHILETVGEIPCRAGEDFARSDRLDTWHMGFKRFTDNPTLAIFIKDITVEKVNT